MVVPGASAVELSARTVPGNLLYPVKILRKGQGADKELISAMLEEARAALDDAAKLPEPKSSTYKTRIASLEGVQKERLRSVEGWVPPDRRGDVAQAIRMCDDGWASMREMMCGPQTRRSGREPRRGMGGMMMGMGNDWCRWVSPLLILSPRNPNTNTGQRTFGFERYFSNSKDYGL